MQFFPCLPAGLIFPALLLLSLISLPNIPASTCRADAPMPTVVEIVSASGRTFRGRLSPATDSTALHLEITQGTMRVTRPIAWRAIDQVQINSQPASLEELVTLALAQKAAESEAEPDSTGILYLGSSEETGADFPKRTFAEWHETVHASSVTDYRVAESTVVEAPVAYVSASAQSANWDADAAVDGLEVTFQAMDVSGQPVAAHGHLEAELYGFRQQSFHHVPHGLGARFDRISTWRIPLEETHGWYGSRVARLPYHGVSPAEEGRIVPQGLLVVRLVIPGQGVFSTSLDDVRLRPYSAIRDANQLRGDPRYVPGENPRYRPYRTP